MSITEHIFHPFVNALGWTIVHSLWQFALVAVLWRLVMHLAAKTHAVVRYNITLFALLAMPLAFIITFIRQYSVYQNAGKIVSIGFEHTEFVMAAGSTDFYLLNKSYPEFISRLEAYTPVIFWLYSLGLIIFSIVTIITYSKWFIIKRRHTFALGNEWLLRIEKLITVAGLAKQVSVYLTSKLSVPVVVGFIKPVVLLPVAMLSSLTTEQVEVIILHELYHIRRKDHYINALQCLFEILFFYHPATWLLGRHLRFEREKVVDEWVVEQCREPLLYANALLNLEENRGVAALQPAVAATQSKSLLFTRIKNFMTMKTRGFNVGQKLAAVLALVAAFISMAWVSPATTINLFDSPLAVENQPALPDRHDLAAITTEEVAFDDPPVLNNATVSTPASPTTIHLNDGKEIRWDALSDKDREQIMKAIEEARLAIAEVNREWTEKLQSDEFRMMMQEAREELQQEMKELNEKFNRGEFQQELEKARIEFEGAMQELREHFQGEEFQEEMAHIQQSFSDAMKQLHEEFTGEELQKKLKQMGETYRQSMGQLNETINSEEFAKRCALPASHLALL